MGLAYAIPNSYQKGTVPTKLKLIVHCGACMINRRQMLSRMMAASAARVPMVNYGVMITYVLGILRRALEPFPDVLAMLDN